MKYFLSLAVVCVLFSAAYGLKCYCSGCAGGIMTCLHTTDHCSTSSNETTCTMDSNCGKTISCCAEDLCNGAKHIGPSAVILMASTALITLFL
ncbi:hypothetical protein J4Q44_G00161980 [Coregonus suidteri]|uniref:Uncharacterized protein n=1 Tax=Coregonus suidteri TaxID=861788 RepID=A0AAN8LXL3_9TELE